MNRFHFRFKALLAAVFVCSVVLLTMSYGAWRKQKYGEPKIKHTKVEKYETEPKTAFVDFDIPQSDMTIPTANCFYRQQTCMIEGHGSKTCVTTQDKKEVFVPFQAYLKKQFDITGSYEERETKEIGKSEEVFVWQQSYAKIHRPNPDILYNVEGIFGPFASYNVENREKRVRCISMVEGVPMSVQWDTTPYFYAIQIAQYALEHYSKNRSMDSRPISVELDIGADQWAREGEAMVEDGKNGKGVMFDGMTDDSVATLKFPNDANLAILQLSIHLQEPETEFQIRITVLDSGKIIILHYAFGDSADCVQENDDRLDENFHFTYTINATAFALATNGTGVNTFTRNVLTDANRAISSTKSLIAGVNGKLSIDMISIDSLAILGGRASITKMELRSTAHDTQFMAAADWFLTNQDRLGGWPINVDRELAGGRLSIKAGWHSAMAQGHGISVLCRAFMATKQKRYLWAAEKATKLFDVLAKDGGVRNILFSKFPWFEEYPTVPGSYVLNGFMYSLVGLHDLMDAAKYANYVTNATRLFDEGIASLYELLPLFDGGSRSYYDLRHVTLKDVSPNIARWDYHSLHIYQLAWIAQLTQNEEIRAALFTRADLWTQYARGEFAKHN